MERQLTFCVHTPLIKIDAGRAVEEDKLSELIAPLTNPGGFKRFTWSSSFREPPRDWLLLPCTTTLSQLLLDLSLIIKFLGTRNILWEGGQVFCQKETSNEIIVISLRGAELFLVDYIDRVPIIEAYSISTSRIS